jgi:hypothetical protein
MESHSGDKKQIPIHMLPESERLLRSHNCWVAEWDGSNIQDEPVDMQKIIQKAFDFYSSGLLPIQVRWRLESDFPQVKSKIRQEAQRRAEKQLCAAETAPPELRRALVAAARAQAIQGALAHGEWGVALRGLDRAGLIAGELREAAGLAEEDLTLTVLVEEDDPIPLPPPAAEESEG